MIQYKVFAPLNAIAFIFVLLFPSIASAWSASGHHVASVIAYESMEPAGRAAVIELLSHHPQFDKHFAPPKGITDKGSIDRWQIGVAGCWPDIIRGTNYDRPTWHYQLGASVVIGDVKPPAEPGPLPPDATLATQELYIGQATTLCVKIFRDKTQRKPDRAIALCWVLPLFADGHQPCHAGSLYAPIFPDGDRGGNSIRFGGRGNLHSSWDSLLGSGATAGSIRKRVAELENVTVDSVRGPDWLRPATWLAESAELGRTHVYTDEVTGPVIAASRGLTEGLQDLKLSEAYFRSAGEVARQRIKLAGLRLGVILTRCVGE